MKPLSLKAQRIIMFIPYINFVLPLFFLYNTHFCYPKSLSRVRVLWVFFSSTLPLVFAAQLIYRFYPTVGAVLDYVNAYVIPLLLGYRFVNLQEELASK